MDENIPSVEYCCPGEKHPISRAVHLGRLAGFYPSCHQCLYRNDTGTFSPRQVRQLQEAQSRRDGPHCLFQAEGAGGVYRNEFGVDDARNVAAAFGMMVSGPEQAIGPETNGCSRAAAGKTIVLAGDGRPITSELVAAASEGLRWSGCDVIDIGPASSACLAFGVRQLRAAGGLLVGNPGSEPQTVGLTLWTSDASPLSTGGTLEPLIALHDRGIERPTRVFGSLRRHQAEPSYLDSLAHCFHGLRPLRLVLDSASLPLGRYLERLVAPTACRVIPCRSTRDELPHQIRSDAAHLAVCIDGNGETCRVFDDLGRLVPHELLLILLVEHVLSARDSFCRCENGAANDSVNASASSCAIVLEDDLSPVAIGRIARLGARVILSPSHRAAMSATVRTHTALFGGGASGRYWHIANRTSAAKCDPFPLPDALMTVAVLLGSLSRNDTPLSALLDREAARE